MAAPPPAPPTEHPPLSPSFCFTPEALQGFLRTSRALTDDPIAQHLSALSAPSRLPFLSSAQRTPSTHTLPRPACARFAATTLFPAWAARGAALEYCKRVAADEDQVERLREEKEREARRREAEAVDPRLDPYGARAPVGETRRERLERTVRAEEGVEGIVRRRTWEVMRERCEGMNGAWQEEMAGSGKDLLARR